MPFWRSTVCRALAAATGATGAEPGPVHLNVSLREPLVPDPTDPAWPDALDGRAGGHPWVEVDAAAPPGGTGSPLPGVERTLVLVGSTRDPGLGRSAVAWAAERGHPVVAEPFGEGSVRAAALPHGPLVLTATDWLDAHQPERVVVVGRITLSRAVGALLRRPGVRVELVSDGEQWPDPSHVAAAVHRPAVLAVAAPPRTADEPGEWARAWQSAGRRVADAVAAQCFSWPTGLAVAQVVASGLPGDALLVLGSSNPVRDLDLVATGPVAGEVLANRGLAGIDGVVSTAVGVALARPGRPAYAVVGAGEPTPALTVVVVNDDGGGIFTTLEPGTAERAADFERVFGTPTGAHLAELCRAHGIRHTLAADRGALASALAAPQDGLAVVEVRVDRATHRQAHIDLRAVAAAALTD